MVVGWIREVLDLRRRRRSGVVGVVGLRGRGDFGRRDEEGWLAVLFVGVEVGWVSRGGERDDRQFL